MRIKEDDHGFKPFSILIENGYDKHSLRLLLGAVDRNGLDPAARNMLNMLLSHINE